MNWILLLASLSLLIILHEFGHFITAKWFNVRVERFYLFFNPWFSIAKKKIGDTVYGLGWLPLGGYVKLAGMIDESMDKDFLKSEPKSYEFRSKPAWQRLIIMLGGIIVNVLLAWLIYSTLLGVYGKKRLKTDSFKYGIEATELGERHGLLDGDKLIAINDKPVKYYTTSIILDVVTNKTSEITVSRDGEIKTITFDKDFREDFLEAGQAPFAPATLAVIGKIDEGSPLSKTGAAVGDLITHINGVAVNSMTGVSEQLDKVQTPKEIEISVNRNGETLNFTATPEIQTRNNFVRRLLGKEPRHIATTLGFVSKEADFFEYETKKYGFFEAIPAGWNETWSELSSYVRQFKLIFTKSGIKQLGGLGTFAKQFSGVDWYGFWRITAFISLILAFMNLLPIPALDGGHALICLIEMVTGKKPNDKFLEVIQIIGFVLLMALILYANGLDAIRG